VGPRYGTEVNPPARRCALCVLRRDPLRPVTAAREDVQAREQLIEPTVRPGADAEERERDREGTARTR